jgi:murein DD-endopeptidase MepM/ murein hydrolase activator NlpD
MAIDPKKLLPSSGGQLTYLAVPTKISLPTAKIIPSNNSKKGTLGVVNLVDDDGSDNGGFTEQQKEDIAVIREKTEKIEVIVKKSIVINLKKIQLQRRQTENQRRKSTEDKGEQKKEKEDKGKGGIPIPKISMFDRLKNFLGSVFVGWLGVKLLKYIPQLIQFVKFIKPIASFLGNFLSGLLDKLVTFIDVGYTVVDKVETTIDNIFGDGGVKKFKEFQSTFTKFMNLAIIAAMLGTGGTDFGLNKGKFSGPQRVGFDRSGRRVSTRAQQRYLSRYGDKKFNERFGNRNARRLDKLARQGIDGRVSRAADPLSGMVQKGVTKVAGKKVGAIAGKIPLVGPLIDFGIRAFIFKEPLGKAAAGAVGAGVGQAIGTWLGGTIGGLAGSVVPIVGNLLGGAAGATLGGLIGGVIGDQIGVSLYNVIAGSEKSGAAQGIEKKAQGGTIGDEESKKQEREKNLEIARRARIYQFTPSKDESHLTEPPDNKPKRGNLFQQLFGFIKGAVQQDPFAAIRGAVNKLRRKNNSLVSKIMSLGIDLAGGKKPDMRSIQQIAKNLVTFFDAALPAPLTMMRSLLQKLSQGGYVMESPIERARRLSDMTRQVERSFVSSVERESKEALGDLNKINGAGARPPVPGAGPGAGAPPGGPSPAATPAGQTAAGASSLMGLTGTTGSTAAAQGAGARVAVSYSPFAKGTSASISSGKGMRWGKPHNGIDVGAAPGTPMYAYLDGQVTHVNTGLGGSLDSGYGYWIVWKDDVHGAYHFFGHLDRPPGLKVGAKFKAGALLANVGGSGSGSLSRYAPHLHWEISTSAPASNGQFSNYQDPIQWVNKYGAVKKTPAKTTSPPPKIDPKGVQSKASYDENKTRVAILEKEVRVPVPVGASGSRRSSASVASIRQQALSATHA